MLKRFSMKFYQKQLDKKEECLPLHTRTVTVPCLDFQGIKPSYTQGIWQKDEFHHCQHQHLSEILTTNSNFKGLFVRNIRLPLYLISKKTTTSLQERYMFVHVDTR